MSDNPWGAGPVFSSKVGDTIVDDEGNHWTCVSKGVYVGEPISSHKEEDVPLTNVMRNAVKEGIIDGSLLFALVYLGLVMITGSFAI